MRRRRGIAPRMLCWPVWLHAIVEVMAGKLYVNVHIAANKGSEIRGQVTKWGTK